VGGLDNRRNRGGFPGRVGAVLGAERFPGRLLRHKNEDIQQHECDNPSHTMDLDGGAESMGALVIVGGGGMVETDRS